MLQLDVKMELAEVDLQLALEIMVADEADHARELPRILKRILARPPHSVRRSFDSVARVLPDLEARANMIAIIDNRNSMQ